MLPEPEDPSQDGRIALRQTVAWRLRELILSGRFSPGERLRETELAMLFGTSRGPVRDAIADLERSGLVRVHPRSGTFVTQLSARDVEEVYSLRLALEQLAVARAVDRAQDGDIAAMEQALDDLSAAMAAGDTRAVGEADMRFHRTIIAAADHQRLRDAWEGVADQTLLLMRRLPDVHPEIQSDVGQHRDVLDGIERRNRGHAVAAMSRHLLAASDAMVANQVPPAATPEGVR